MSVYDNYHQYGNGLRPEPEPEPILGPGHSSYTAKPVILGPNSILIYQQQNIR